MYANLRILLLTPPLVGEELKERGILVFVDLHYFIKKTQKIIYFFRVVIALA